MTKIFGMIGQFTYTVFSINSELNSQLTWTETNPLSISPMNSTYWIPIETAYELVYASKFAVNTSVDMAFEATENFFIEFSHMMSYL